MSGRIARRTCAGSDASIYEWGNSERPDDQGRAPCPVCGKRVQIVARNGRRGVMPTHAPPLGGTRLAAPVEVQGAGKERLPHDWRSTQAKAKAWLGVCATLEEVYPEWQEHSGTGAESAAAAIRALAGRPAPAAEAFGWLVRGGGRDPVQPNDRWQYVHGEARPDCSWTHQEIIPVYTRPAAPLSEGVRLAVSALQSAQQNVAARRPPGSSDPESAGYDHDAFMWDHYQHAIDAITSPSPQPTDEATDADPVTWSESIAQVARENAEDADRLDWLEEQAKKSRTGLSLSYTRPFDGKGGYRVMRYHSIGEFHATARAAIDAARLATPPDNAAGREGWR